MMWGVFDPDDQIPVPEVIPVDHNGFALEGHTAGLDCICQPILDHCDEECEWPDTIHHNHFATKVMFP